jgi:hypothetical protein
MSSNSSTAKSTKKEQTLLTPALNTTCMAKVVIN